VQTAVPKPVVDTLAPVDTAHERIVPRRAPAQTRRPRQCA
jgi:hypothetical protein